MKGSVTYIDGRRVVLDENGKPCRSCNSLLDFQAATKGGAGVGMGVGMGSGVAATAGKTNSGYTKECPPDVEGIGRATWTFLHSMAAQYPEKASDADKTRMKSFLNIFSDVYPCWYCAEDLQVWMKKNEPKVGGREELGNWLCDAHNEVNRKLDKPIFDCKEWKARWRDGWNDGRC